MDWSGRHVTRRRISAPWWHDPDEVDGYQQDGLRWPVETRRFAYLAPFGGFTQDLGRGRIGLNKQALEENTELMPGDRVTVSVFEHGQPVPILAQPTFEVVPVDFEMPDAYLHTTDGQAVLSEYEAVEAYLGLDGLSEDLQVVLNGVLAVRMRRNAGA